MKIKIKNHPLIKDIKIFKFSKFEDERGLFSRKYCEIQLSDLNFKIKQINYSKNEKKYYCRL